MKHHIFPTILVGFLPITIHAKPLVPPCTETQITQQTEGCISDEYIASDKALNQAYSALMSEARDRFSIAPEVGKNFRNTVRDAQRAWIKFRDKSCSAEAFGSRPGTEAHVADFSTCLTRLTKTRTQELDAMRQSDFYSERMAFDCPVEGQNIEFQPPKPDKSDATVTKLAKWGKAHQIWKGDLNGDEITDYILWLTDTCGNYGECEFGVFAGCLTQNRFVTVWQPEYAYGFNIAPERTSHLDEKTGTYWLDLELTLRVLSSNGADYTVKKPLVFNGTRYSLPAEDK